MGTITIAGRALAAARPADLAERIATSSGLSLAEARTMLVSSLVPALLARAIDPLLTDADRPDLAAIGEMLDPARTAMEAVSAQVMAFYSDAPAEGGTDASE